MYATYQDAIRRARTLTSEIEKSHSVDEIADKACMVISLLIGDSSFYARQCRKLKEAQSCGV